MNELHDDRNIYECVEPEVGRELYRATLPDASNGQRKLRADHLLICDACRLEAAVAEAIGTGLAEGSLTLPGATTRRSAHHRALRLPTMLAAAAASFAVVGFVLTAVLPPTPMTVPGIDRAGSTVGFVRPVEGETVAARGPGFHWRPLPGAGSYRFRVEEVAGEFSWEGASPGTALVLPDDVPLPIGREFRAYLIPVPGDVVPAGSLSVRFRSGGPMAVLKYRALAAAWPARFLVVTGILLGMAALAVRSRIGWRDPDAAI